MKKLLVLAALFVALAIPTVAQAKVPVPPALGVTPVLVNPNVACGSGSCQDGGGPPNSWCNAWALHTYTYWNGHTYFCTVPPGTQNYYWLFYS